MYSEFTEIYYDPTPIFQPIPNLSTMRLYLSSFRLGNQAQRLADLVGSNKRAAVVVNACDQMMDEERKARVQQESAALESLGLVPVELDLRHYFNNESKQQELGPFLAGCGLVWVRGGNTFVLMRAMRASGFDTIITDMLERDAIAYGGYSAGIIALTPTLRGSEVVDDPVSIPAGYTSEVIWDGLGLLPYAIAPHYRSDHPESADVEKMVHYLIDNHILFRALRDGEAIVVDGEHDEVVS
jgi:dipeptidase E